MKRTAPFRLWMILLIAALAFAEMTPRERGEQMASFELVWNTVRDRNPDPKFHGLDWQAVHDSFRPRVEKAKSDVEVRALLREMIGKLGMSHYAILPGDLYAGADSQPGNTAIETVYLDGKPVVKRVAPDSAAARAGIQPGMVLEGINGAKMAPAPEDTESRAIAAKSISGKLAGDARVDVVDANGNTKHVDLVQFGNLPEMRVEFESKTLAGGIGYIRFNEFLDPVNLMPRFEAALKGFEKAPGVVLDLRGNRGGIGIMAMGIAGFFVGDSGRQLGEMKMRETTLKFNVFPRANVYTGRLAVLLDEGSASTTEILAQGLQDLKRARIFGTRSAGAALPSDIIRLPNGDGFQYPTASYTSANGRVLEGNGVQPDVEIRQSREDIAAGRDPVIDAAAAWIARP